jgi:hypothetical protein
MVSEAAATYPSSADANPDSGLVAPLAETVRPVPRLQYLHSYSYVFESPNWFSNLALSSVCMMIPIVGPIVLWGYQFEIIDRLHRAPKHIYPDFEFNRFGEYLTRGVWRFLVNMITQMILVPVNLFVVYGSMFAIMGIGMAAAPNPNAAGPAIAIAAMIIVPLAIAAIMGAALLIRFFTLPLVLKASLSGDAGGLVDFKFLGDFVRRTWREMLMEMLWMLVTTPIVAVLGYAMCLIGAFPAFVLIGMADAQTNWQLYEIYLARGGTPIELKAAKPGPVVAVPYDPAQHYAQGTYGVPPTYGGQPTYSSPSNYPQTPPAAQGPYGPLR